MNLKCIVFFGHTIYKNFKLYTRNAYFFLLRMTRLVFGFGIRPIVCTRDLRLRGGDLFKGYYLVFTQVSEKTTENSERIRL